jgi:hypothetical protein
VDDQQARERAIWDAAYAAGYRHGQAALPPAVPVPRHADVIELAGRRVLRRDAAGCN